MRSREDLQKDLREISKKIWVLEFINLSSLIFRSRRIRAKNQIAVRQNSMLKKELEAILLHQNIRFPEITKKGFPGHKSHEISLEKLPILKIHAEDMKLIVDAIFSRSQEELYSS